MLKQSGSKVIGLLLFMLFFQVEGQAQDFSMLRSRLNQYSNQYGTNAVLMIYKDGKRVFKENRGTYTPDTPEKIASSTKWLSAACIMTLVDDGKLKLDDKVSMYVPAFKTIGFKDITLRQCLSHTTCIKSDPLKKVFASAIRRKTLQQMVEAIPAEHKLYATPGTSFYYGNIGLLIAGRVAEVVSGKDWSALFNLKIATPCQMKQTSYPEGGLQMIAGGATSTAHDYMNFLQMLLNKGEFNGQRVLSAMAIQVMQQSQTAGLATESTPEIAGTFEYGLGEWIMDKEGNAVTQVGSAGLFGCWPIINIKNEYAWILFVKNNRHRGRKEMMADFTRTIAKIMQ